MGAEESKKPILITNNVIPFKKVEDYKKSTPEEKGVDKMKYSNITIHKNKKCNTWYTRYRKDGKQYYISAKTQKECYEKLKSKINNTKAEKTKEELYTLEKWYNKWLELFKLNKIKKNTLVDYKSMYKHLKEKFLKKDIKKISKIEILEQINNISGERQKQKVFTFLKDIFTKAFNYNIIKENIFNTLEKPKHIKKKGKCLTSEEQERFIKNCNTRERKLFLIILYQGLRRGEALALTYNDIDIENKIININKSKDDFNKINTPKNNYSKRQIPLFDITIKNIKDIIIEKSNNFIFSFNTKKAQNIFKEILKESNIDLSFRIHNLRHTFITNCKNLNIPEHIIQTWVGHQIGSKITSQVYTHSKQENLIENEKIINKFYSHSTQKKED